MPAVSVRKRHDSSAGYTHSACTHTAHTHTEHTGGPHHRWTRRFGSRQDSTVLCVHKTAALGIHTVHARTQHTHTQSTRADLIIGGHGGLAVVARSRLPPPHVQHIQHYVYASHIRVRWRLFMAAAVCGGSGNSSPLSSAARETSHIQNACVLTRQEAANALWCNILHGTYACGAAEAPARAVGLKHDT